MASGDGSVTEICRTSRYVLTRVRAASGARQVCKRVLAAAADPRAAAARLRHEYDLLAPLSIPGVVKAVGWEAHPIAPALLLEDAGPNDLAARLQGKPLPLPAFLRMAIALTEAVAGLHGRRIIHRDISPANIVIGEDGRPTLVDFEGAVVAGPEALAGLPPPPPGTAPHPAPNQTGGRKPPAAPPPPP